MPVVVHLSEATSEQPSEKLTNKQAVASQCSSELGFRFTFKVLVAISPLDRTKRTVSTVVMS